MSSTEQTPVVMPAIVDRDPVMFAIGTEGSAPVLARQSKADVEAMLPLRFWSLRAIGQRISSGVERYRRIPRRDFLKRFYQPERIQAAGSDEAIKAVSKHYFRNTKGRTRSGLWRHSLARVKAADYLPEARRFLHEAEVIIDRLVGKGVLELARREAKFIDVGKKGFGAQVTQDKINEHLIREALAGWKVVRLKGGDPSVFGRLDDSQRLLKPALIARLLMARVSRGGCSQS